MTLDTDGDRSSFFRDHMASLYEFKPSDRDYAARLCLTTKDLAFFAAKRCIEGLPHDARTNETCTAFLLSMSCCSGANSVADPEKSVGSWALVLLQRYSRITWEITSNVLKVSRSL